MKDLIESAKHVLLEQSDNRPGKNVDHGPTSNMKSVNPKAKRIEPKKNKEVTKKNIKKGLKVKIVGDNDRSDFGQTGVITGFGLNRSNTMSAQIKLDKKVGTLRNVSHYLRDLEIV